MSDLETQTMETIEALEEVEKPKPQPKTEPKQGKRYSVVWKFFDVLEENIAKCRLCHRDFSFKTTTSNLKKHVRKRHKSVNIDAEDPSECITLVNCDNIEIQEGMIEIPGSSGDLSPLKEYLKIEPVRRVQRKAPEKRAASRVLSSDLDTHEYGRPQKEMRVAEDDDDVFGRFLIVEMKKLTDVKLKNRCKRDILSILMEYGSAQDGELRDEETG